MKKILLPLACVLPALIQADDRFLLVGGGPNPQNSQFSIESNVLWFDHLAKAGQFSHTQTLFGSGANHPAEIQYVSENLPSLGALGVIFDNRNQEKFAYRASLLDSSKTESATSEEVSKTVESELSSLAAEDSLFLIFSGHGGRTNTAKDNYLHLWGNSQLSVGQLHTTVQSNLSEGSFRFVLPQCFSGDFTSLSYSNLKDKKGVTGAVCGFTSVSQWDYAEGCTASVNTEDYRDYASLLMQSVVGENRQGNPAPKAWDLNKDGKTSLYEAHLFTVAMSETADIPRSTSEQYLLDTERTINRWQSLRFGSEQNDYSMAASRMVQDFQSAFGTPEYAKELSEKLHDARRELDQKTTVEYNNMDERVILQRKLQEQLYLQWPQLKEPMTPLFQDTINNQLRSINAWLEALPDYQALRSLEMEADRLSQEWIVANRELAKFKRIQRLMKLSRLHNETMRQGGTRKDEYLSLQRCEQWNPPIQ